MRSVLFALLLIALPAFGADYTVATGPDGNVVRVLQLPDLRCPEDYGGCYYQHVIAGYGDDMKARAHELDHVAGMKHGYWLPAGNGDKCAEILIQGHTQWRVGNLLCRRSDGDYYQTQE